MDLYYTSSVILTVLHHFTKYKNFSTENHNICRSKFLYKNIKIQIWVIGPAQSWINFRISHIAQKGKTNTTVRRYGEL